MQWAISKSVEEIGEHGECHTLFTLSISSLFGYYLFKHVFGFVL